MAIDLESIPERQTQLASVFIGRFQPFHLGHLEIVKQMTQLNQRNHPVLLVVKGKRTGLNLLNNPFTESYQDWMIHKTLQEFTPRIKFVENGFLPAAFNDLRRDGLEPVMVYAGDDRFDHYQRQFERGFVPDNKRYFIQWIQPMRNGSGTAVRESILNNDRTAFEKLMPVQLHDEWEIMREILIGVWEKTKPKI